MPCLATDDDIRRTILRKMLRLEYIGGRHTSIENLPKGFPKHERGRVMKVARMMLKEGYFIAKQKPDGLHVSLDPRVLKEIKSEVGSDW
jgi:hypothetical protein